MRTLLLLTAAALVLVAGCATPTTTMKPAAASNATTHTTTAAAAATTPHSLIVKADGTTPAGPAACPTQQDQCIGYAILPAKTAFQQHPDGTLVAAHLTMTWSAATPATDTMLLGIADGNDGKWQYTYASGGSPVKLDKTITIPLGHEVWVYANAYKCSPPPVSGCASTAQDFHVEGTIDET